MRYSKHQLVLSRRGLIRLGQTKVGDKIWTLEGWRRVGNISSKRSKVYKHKTFHGYEIESNNKIKNFLVLSGPSNPVNLPEVKLDQAVYASNSGTLNRDIVLPKTLNENLAYLLGYSYGDGGVEYKNYEPRKLELSSSHDHPLVEEKLKKIIFHQFNYEPKSIIGYGGNLNRITIYSKSILYFLRQNKILKESQYRLIVPEKILISPRNVQLSFLAGYFDADGHASTLKKEFGVSSTCHDIIKCQQLIYIANNIPCCVRPKKEKDLYEDGLKLSFPGQFSQTKLAKNLPSIKVVGKPTVEKDISFDYIVTKTGRFFPDTLDHISTAYNDCIELDVKNFWCQGLICG